MVFKSPCSASAAAQGHTSGQPKAPLGFEPRISCLLDRRFNQLSPGANTRKLSLREGDSEDQSMIKLRCLPALVHFHGVLSFKSQLRGGCQNPRSASAAAQRKTSGQSKAPLGFEPSISCLRDRRFNQLSQGANLQAQSPGGGDSEDQSIQR